MFPLRICGCFRFHPAFRIGVLRNAVNSLDVRDAKASAPADEASPWKLTKVPWKLMDIDGWKMYPFKKFLFNPPANNHYKMAGHVAPISRDFSLNQPRKNGVVHVIL